MGLHFLRNLASLLAELGSVFGEKSTFRQNYASSTHFNVISNILLVMQHHYAKPVIPKSFAGINFAEPKITFRLCLAPNKNVSQGSHFAIRCHKIKLVRSEVRGSSKRTSLCKSPLAYCVSCQILVYLKFLTLTTKSAKVQLTRGCFL